MHQGAHGAQRPPPAVTLQRLCSKVHAQVAHGARVAILQATDGMLVKGLLHAGCLAGGLLLRRHLRVVLAMRVPAGRRGAAPHEGRVIVRGIMAVRERVPICEYMTIAVRKSMLCRRGAVSVAVCKGVAIDCEGVLSRRCVVRI